MREMQRSRDFYVSLIGHNEGRSASDHRLVEVEVRETDYILINGTTATSIGSRFLANLFLDMPHLDFTEPSRFEHALARSISGVMNWDHDYFLDHVIPETVSFAYNTAFRTIKMVINLVNMNKTCDRDACAICLEELLRGSPSIVGMMCGHVFHEDCAARWLEGSNTCPLCRKPGNLQIPLTEPNQTAKFQTD